MAQVTLKGNVTSIKGDLPAIESTAPDFKFVKTDLHNGYCIFKYPKI